MTDAEIYAYRQRGISAQNIGAAAALNAGGSGFNRAFISGGQANGLDGTSTFGGAMLNLGMSQGLRGRGMSEFLGAVGGIGAMYSSMGSNIISQNAEGGTLQQRTFAGELTGFVRQGLEAGYSAFQGAGGVRQAGRILGSGLSAGGQISDMLGTGGMFGTMIMASVMGEVGDPFKAKRKIEEMGLAEMRQRALASAGGNEEVVRALLTGDDIGQKTIDTFLGFTPEAPLRDPGLKKKLLTGSAAQAKAESMADVARTFQTETFKVLEAADRQIKEQRQQNITLKQMKALLEKIEKKS